MRGSLNGGKVWAGRGLIQLRLTVMLRGFFTLSVGIMSLAMILIFSILTSPFPASADPFFTPPDIPELTDYVPDPERANVKRLLREINLLRRKCTQTGCPLEQNTCLRDLQYEIWGEAAYGGVLDADSKAEFLRLFEAYGWSIGGDTIYLRGKREPDHVARPGETPPGGEGLTERGWENAAARARQHADDPNGYSSWLAGNRLGRTSISDIDSHCNLQMRNAALPDVQAPTIPSIVVPQVPAPGVRNPAPGHPAGPTVPGQARAPNVPVPHGQSQNPQSDITGIGTHVGNLPDPGPTIQISRPNGVKIDATPTGETNNLSDLRSQILNLPRSGDNIGQ